MSKALHAFLCHRGDALALARAEEGVDARLLEASLLLCSRNARDFEQAGWVFARLHWMPKSAAQAAHFAAIRRALDGDYGGACRAYDEILASNPRDLLALAVAQSFDYLLGNPQAQRARPGSASAPARLPGQRLGLGVLEVGVRRLDAREHRPGIGGRLGVHRRRQQRQRPEDDPWYPSCSTPASPGSRGARPSGPRSTSTRCMSNSCAVCPEVVPL